MTLVELMVSLAVTALVMASVMGIFTAQHRNYVRDRSEKEAFLDTLDVVRVLERDLREAGWSVPANMALFIEDGGDNGSDRIYINDVDLIDPILHASRLVESSCPGCLRVDSLSGTHVTLTDPWEPSPSDLDINADGKKDFDNSSYHFVITDTTNPEKKVDYIKAISGTTLTLYKGVEGTMLAPAIYYCVDTGAANCHPNGALETRVLRRSDRNTQGRVPVADNVVDLQVAYLAVDNDTTSTTRWYGEANCSGPGLGANKCTRNPFQPERIRLIRLTVVLRSPTKDKDRLNDPRYCRPAVENRRAGTKPDECGYQYKVHTVHIHPRNT
uniref:Type IV pilus assembly protein PilW n=1 Tax=Desulfacinum infernum TaxID=35837 RepID=A0A832ED71_9BACT